MNMDNMREYLDKLGHIASEEQLDEKENKTFPKVFNDEGVLVANDPDSALELIADEVPEHVDMYMDAIRSGDYESLLDALDGFGYTFKYDEEDTLEEGGVKDMIQDVEEGMGKEEFEKKYPGQNYDEIRQEIEDRMNEAKKAPLTAELLQKGYDQVYNFVGEYGDAALEYLDDNAPTFNNLFTKYDGDLDVIASKVDMTTFNQIMDELNDVAYDLEGGVLESKVQENDIEMEEDCGCEDDAMVSVPVQELQDILQLAGYENYADKIEEYANEPEEEYSDTEDQLIGLSGGLNRPKKQYPASAPGDNPMDQEPREVEETMEAVEEKLYKSYKDFLEEAEDVK